MKELHLKDGVFLLKDSEEYVIGETMMLEVGAGLYVKVRVCGTMKTSPDSPKFRLFQLNPQ